MKIVAISDTHGLHDGIQLPTGDMLIHAGDVSSHGTSKQVKKFLKWFSAQDFKYKIFIAGNHDYMFERYTKEKITTLIPDNVIYLNDSGVTIEGLKIWGSPIQPWFMDWAFNRQRGEAIDKHWQLIPDDIDILLVHGPPFGILDTLISGEPVGCRMLLKKIQAIKPKFVVFGHIHESYGQAVIDNIHYINASVLDVHYRIANAPTIIHI